MNKILSEQELKEMEIRIYETYGMNKFSPQDIIDLICTSQKYVSSMKILEPVKIEKELADYIKNKNEYDILELYINNCRNMNSPMGDLMANKLIKILHNGYTIN